MSRLADGGMIPGSGGEHGDEVPPLLSRGWCEIVLTRRQMLTLGLGGTGCGCQGDCKCGVPGAGQ